MLNELIEELPNEKAYLELLNRYQKLLHKYANLLNYEDAYEDLRLFFLELVYHMRGAPVLKKGEGAIVKYIVMSVKNKYIALSKRQGQRSESSFSELSDEQLAIIESMSSERDEQDITEFFPVSGGLSEREEVVIRELIVEGYSVCDVAAKHNVSRQAVNQMKLRALKKIKDELI